MVFDFNINNYSFIETLQLFDLKTGCEITDEHIKYAKTKVLSMHPDKSKLPSEYFIFYKKAFEIVFQYYQCQPEVKVRRTISDKATLYSSNVADEAQEKQIKQHIQSMDVSEFNKYFNDLFDGHMIDKEQTQRQNERNSWFKNTEPQFPDLNINKSNIDSCIEDLKLTNKGGNLCEIKEPCSGVHHFGSKIYNDDEETDSYIYCNPSSKLLFDDLRKVHLNESIFNIEVVTTEPKSKFNSCDELNRHRTLEEKNLRTHHETDEYKANLNAKTAYHKRLLEQNQNDIVRTNKYSKLNEKIISKFLRLSNT